MEIDMADERERQRASWVPDIARVMRTHDFRTTLSEQSDDRRQSFVVTLHDDTMAYVFERLREVGLPCVLAMPTEDHLALASLSVASRERLVVADEDDAVAQIHDDATVAMFFTLLRQSPGPVVFAQLTARLVDSGELQPA